MIKKLIQWLYDRIFEEPFLYGLHDDKCNFKYINTGGWLWRCSRIKVIYNYFGGVIESTVWGIKIMPSNYFEVGKE
jgi:hypothetical protein